MTDQKLALDAALPPSLSGASVDYARLDRLIADGLPARYAAADPFPHMVIDDFLLPEVVAVAAREARETEIPVDPNFYGSFEKFKLSAKERFAPTIRRITDELHSAEFLRRVERISGIADLVADETLEGGGIHRIGTGGFLKVHTDFNFHRVTGLHRRLNLLVYLNPDWDDDWGGRLELWKPDMSARAAAFAPRFNRAIMFTTTDESYHGHPEPLATPPGHYRHSLAYYYYTADVPAQSRFGASEMTNYQPRPGERFGGRHRLHQLMIRNPLFRPALSVLKRMLGK